MTQENQAVDPTPDPTPISDTATTGDPVEAKASEVKKNPALASAVQPEIKETCDECGAEAPNHQASCSKFVG